MDSLVLALMFSPAAQADTIEVPGDVPSISQAMTLVDFSDGVLDTIRVSAGAQTDDYISIDEPVIIESVGGSAAITLGSSSENSVFKVDCTAQSCTTTPVTIRGFTLENLYGTGVQLIEVTDPSASLVIEDIVVDGMVDGLSGSVVYAHGGGDLTLRNVVLRDISDAFGGVISFGVFYGGGVVTIEDSVFDGLLLDSTAPGAWVQISFAESYHSSRNQFSGGSSTDRGGAVMLYGVTNAFIDGDSYTDNYAASGGGAIYTDLVDSLVVSSSTFTANRTGAGGTAGLHVLEGGSIELLENFFTEHDTGRAIHIENTPDVLALRNDVCANNAGFFKPTVSVVESGSTRNRWANNVFNANTTGAALSNESHYIEVHNNIFAQNSGKPVQAFDGQSAPLDFRNNLVMQNDGTGGWALAGGTADSFQYNWYWSNTAGVHASAFPPGTNMDAEPQVRDYRFDDLCIDDWAPIGGGNLPGAGDQNLLNPDGSPSDPGIFGGPDADPALWVDGDLDGWLGVYDCNDDDAAIFPGQDEICNGVDDDCDGEIDDEPIDGRWYNDIDGDGYGSGTAQIRCTAPGSTWVELAGDCKPSNRAVHPGAVEICDAIDNNCSGDQADATDMALWYLDADGDSYGAEGSDPFVACEAPTAPPYADRSGDCSDDDSLVHPGADELCDGIDNDCDPSNDAEEVTWYLDDDGDGYGVSTETVLDCARPTGHVDQGGDCDDANVDAHPSGVEACDGVDTDCDGEQDNGFQGSTWYADIDADGFGDPSDSKLACMAPTGWVENSDDCAPNDASIHPDADEYCNGLDDNCNSVPDDDAVDRTEWFVDDDSDGHGTSPANLSCEAIPGHVSTAGDCNDSDPAVNPDAEVDHWNAIDSDCDGITSVWELSGGGCSTSGQGQGGVWLAALLLLWRRR